MSETRRAGRAVVICTGRRTGSTLLGDGLRGTGRVGRPAEYFDVHQGNRNYWINRLAIQDDSQYFDKVLTAGTTPNGVFGLKLMWYQIPSLVYFYNLAHGTNPLDPRQKKFHRILNERVGPTDFIWLRRKNKIAQGISDYRAIRTDVWRVRRGLEPELADTKQIIEFDYEAIDRQVRLAEKFDQQWQEYFVANRLKATVVIYEEFVAQFEPTIRALCSILKLDKPDPLTIAAPGWEQQADEVSLRWEHEYARIRADIETHAPVSVITPDPEPEEVARPLGPPEPDTSHTLIAYDLGTKFGCKLVPGSSRRAWMDATSQHFAYRCLPLVIANQHGWMLLSPFRFEVAWNGGGMVDDITIIYPEGEQRKFISSHFGSGIVTFMLEYIFRTPPGYNLHARGPANMPKDGIYPLEGIIETDWSEATFTMNWKITRPNHTIVFEKDEPLCMITPVARGAVEEFKAEIRSLDENPDLAEGYLAWSKSRSSFNKDLKDETSEAKRQGWQKHYVKGETVTQVKAAVHQTAVSLAEFEDRRRK